MNGISLTLKQEQDVMLTFLSSSTILNIYK